MNASANTREYPLIIFDGVCNLCNRSVQAIIQRDSEQRFRFTSLQSNTGQEILSRYANELGKIDSIILLNQDTVFQRSDAIFEIIKIMGGLGYLLYVFKILPKPFRDTLYDWIARNRYRWFGKQDVCMVPTPELENRFLD